MSSNAATSPPSEGRGSEQSATVGIVHSDHLSQVKTHRRHRSLSTHQDVGDPSIELRNLRTITHSDSDSSPIIDPIDAKDPELLYSSGNNLIASNMTHNAQSPIAWSTPAQPRAPPFSTYSDPPTLHERPQMPTSSSLTPPTSKPREASPIATMSTSVTSNPHQSTTTTTTSSRYLPQVKEGEASKSQLWLDGNRLGKWSDSGGGEQRSEGFNVGNRGDGPRGRSSSLDSQGGQTFDRDAALGSSIGSSYQTSGIGIGKDGELDQRRPHSTASPESLRSRSSLINSPIGSETSNLRSGFDMVPISGVGNGPSSPFTESSSRHGDVDTSGSGSGSGSGNASEEKLQGAVGNSIFNEPKQSTPSKEFRTSSLRSSSRRLPPPRSSTHQIEGGRDRTREVRRETSFGTSSDLSGGEELSTGSQDGIRMNWEDRYGQVYSGPHDSSPFRQLSRSTSLNSQGDGSHPYSPDSRPYRGLDSISRAQSATGFGMEEQISNLLKSNSEMTQALASREEDIRSLLSRVDALSSQIARMSGSNSASSTTSAAPIPPYMASSGISATSDQVGVILGDEYSSIARRNTIKPDAQLSEQTEEKSSSGETITKPGEVVAPKAQVGSIQAISEAETSPASSAPQLSPSTTTFSLSPTTTKREEGSMPGTPDAFSPYQDLADKEAKTSSQGGLNPGRPAFSSSNPPSGPSGLGFMPYGNAMPFNFPPTANFDGNQAQRELGGDQFLGENQGNNNFQPLITQAPFQPQRTRPAQLSPLGNLNPLGQSSGLNPYMDPMTIYGNISHFQPNPLNLGWNHPNSGIQLGLQAELGGWRGAPAPSTFSPSQRPPPSPGLVHEGLHFPNVGRSLGLDKDETEDQSQAGASDLEDERQFRSHEPQESIPLLGGSGNFPTSFPSNTFGSPSLPLPTSVVTRPSSGANEEAFNSSSSRPSSEVGQSGGEDSSLPSSTYSTRSSRSGSLLSGGSFNVPSVATGRAPVPSFFSSAVNPIGVGGTPGLASQHARSISQGSALQGSPGSIEANRCALMRSASYSARNIAASVAPAFVGGSSSSAASLSDSTSIALDANSPNRKRSLPSMTPVVGGSQPSVPNQRGISAPQDLYSPDATALVQRALASRSPEASINLQQQLKNSSPERKLSILRAMAPHLVQLSLDKHGNFLTQRAIGIDPEISLQLKGHFVPLSLNQFGCHVVQRVLDEEEPKTIMVVEELLARDLAVTLTSRNSIHVWQKILEIQWSHDDFRTTLFEIINQTMRGRWAETAQLETGSIIVQNLFESGNLDEKKECMVEVLANVTQIAQNQWGVWVVQHIIDHAEEDWKAEALDRLAGSGVSLSLSQYGQKAIMSALKSGDQAFLEKYLDLLCGPDKSNNSGESSATVFTSSNPNAGISRRVGLVDIASAPQGLQIITQLITTVTQPQRERIISTVRKNSVFLKGSKSGLKVHQLCERARAFKGY